jgi:LAS superfamily LD-carboxypeptidase LdcB
MKNNLFTQIGTGRLIIMGAFLTVAGAMGFFVYEGDKRTIALSLQIQDLSARLDSQNAELTANIDQLEQTLASNITKTQDTLASAIEKEKLRVSAQIGTVQSEVGQIGQSVGTLEKLQKTDPELLQKYSKVFFLNEHYEPPRLAQIPSQYKFNGNKNLLVHEQAWPHLQSLLNKASNEGIPLFVFSAFRSFSEQQAIKGKYTIVYGEGSANQFSADQGYSEHQLGTTVDFITTGIDGTLFGFENTAAYSWLLKNAHRYGFILSYPEHNAYYIFEPWHWRYVGVELATHLYNTNKHFYDLDQREIDEYLAAIFD